MVEFRCISADPPWLERGGGKIKRGADRHYPLMTTADIIRTMHDAPCWTPAESCHLWLWVTNNFLRDGLRVIEELGFRYITNVVWDKGSIGLGQYIRGQHELLLFAVRGKAMMPDPPAQGSVIRIKRERHSKKPQGVFDLVERVSPGPRLEMFARETRPGWSSWGNEIPEARKSPPPRPTLTTT